MTINSKTKTKDIMQLLTEERVRQLTAEIPAVPLDKPLMQMSCGEFIMALSEGFAMSFFRTEKYAFRAFGKYKQYMAEMQGITSYLKRYEVEQEADEVAAADKVAFPTLQERILLDCVRYYGLHSTEDAERLPLADWLLLVKSEGSAAQYQRRLSKIQRNKQQQHGNSKGKY